MSFGSALAQTYYAGREQDMQRKRDEQAAIAQKNQTALAQQQNARAEAEASRQQQAFELAAEDRRKQDEYNSALSGIYGGQMWTPAAVGAAPPSAPAPPAKPAAPPVKPAAPPAAPVTTTSAQPVESAPPPVGLPSAVPAQETPSTPSARAPAVIGPDQLLNAAQLAAHYGRPEAFQLWQQASTAVANRLKVDVLKAGASDEALSAFADRFNDGHKMTIEPVEGGDGLKKYTYAGVPVYARSARDAAVQIGDLITNDPAAATAHYLQFGEYNDKLATGASERKSREDTAAYQRGMLANDTKQVEEAIRHNGVEENLARQAAAAAARAASAARADEWKVTTLTDPAGNVVSGMVNKAGQTRLLTSGGQFVVGGNAALAAAQAAAAHAPGITLHVDDATGNIVYQNAAGVTATDIPSLLPTRSATAPAQAATPVAPKAQPAPREAGIAGDIPSALGNVWKPFRVDTYPNAGTSVDPEAVGLPSYKGR